MKSPRQTILAVLAETLPDVPASTRNGIVRDIFQRIEDPATPALKSNCALGALARWPGERGLVITRVDVVGPDAPSVRHRGELRIEIDMTATLKGDYKPVISILIMDMNVDVTRIYSPPLVAKLNEGDTTTATVVVDDLTLTPGDYAFSVALFKSFDANDTGTAKRFEILGRSFELKVVGDPKPGIFAPAASWSKS